MNRRTLLVGAVVVALCGGSAFAEEEASHKLQKIDGLPEGLAEKVAAQLSSAGHRIVGPDGPLVEIWLAAKPAVKAGFSPTFRVNYPFKPGHLVGVLRVPEGAKFSDFRGQELKPGLYTLRYGQQPQDGNHIGTSQTADFLLALPAKADTKPEPIAADEELAQKSAEAVGTSHPAIFSLLPPKDKTPKTAELTHDADNDFWIFTTTGSGQAEDKKVEVPMRVIAIGETDA